VPEQLEHDTGMIASPAGAERRRPGRVEYANPHLVRLLRHAAATPITADADAAHRSRRAADNLAAARGIGVSALLGAMAWAGFLTGVWLLLRP
jgi:hypothetical protein